MDLAYYQLAQPVSGRLADVELAAESPGHLLGFVLVVHHELVLLFLVDVNVKF